MSMTSWSYTNPDFSSYYLAKFFRRMIIRYRECGYGELQDKNKRELKALGYDMDVKLKQLKNYEYLRINEQKYY
ncbi:hypothetical protein BS638_10370 [Clostridium tepidum]|uniref:Uncharacterized protein n=2 Tax=Clostridium tepidum TaxID=1962263 RepID=A0A1S9I2X9_9CLOT|nr:hypothetical protein BS638_10370 [Clostridium tepidum]